MTENNTINETPAISEEKEILQVADEEKIVDELIQETEKVDSVEQEDENLKDMPFPKVLSKESDLDQFKDENGIVDKDKLAQSIKKDLNDFQEEGKKFFKTLYDGKKAGRRNIIEELKKQKEDPKNANNKVLQNRFDSLIAIYEDSIKLYNLLGEGCYYGNYKMPTETEYANIYRDIRKKLSLAKKYTFYDISKLEECLFNLLEDPYNKFVRVFLFRFYNYAQQTKLDSCALYVSNIIINIYKFSDQQNQEEMTPEDLEDKKTFIQGIKNLIDRSDDFEENLTLS